jgi:hypothetical protein
MLLLFFRMSAAKSAEEEKAPIVPLAVYVDKAEVGHTWSKQYKR